jgi:sec-independent protein translocase protein TatA
MFLDVGAPEVVVILAVALIVFGPKKLPELGRTLGKTLKEFKRASNELMSSIHDPDTLEEKPKEPQQVIKKDGEI